MAVSIGLTALGGLYSVVWTDTIQFVIMVIMILVVAPIVVFSKASFADLNAAAAAVGGTLTNPAKNVPLSYIILTLLTVACSIPGDPTIPQRALAGDTVKTVKRSFYYSTVGIILMGIAMTLVGLGALTLMPNLAQTHGTQEAAFPIFIINYFPPVLKGLGISALMAAVVSTVTSMLLVGTTHLVYDAGQVLFPKASDHTFKRIMPIAIVVLGAFITWISLSVESIVKILYVVNSLTGAALVLPLLFALYWKKLSKWGVTLGMVFGAVYVVLAFFLQWNAPGGDPVYLGMALSLVGMIGGSLVLPDQQPKAEAAEQK
jgi:SSS family solute:Na+ symporter